MDRCVPYYIANREQGEMIPPQCPPLPTPVGQCDCPDPKHVKTAVSWYSVCHLFKWSTLLTECILHHRVMM